MMATPEAEVVLKTNELGLRDKPNHAILENPLRILVIGDGDVEGWWAEKEKSIPALLGSRIPDAYFINAGLREAGPLRQSERLPALIQAYRPQGILWFVGERARLEDRAACSAKRTCALCQGFQEVASLVAKEKIPLLGFFRLGAGEETIMACLITAKLDFRIDTAFRDLPAAEKQRFLWENDDHLNPDAYVREVDLATDHVQYWLASLKSKTPHPSQERGHAKPKNEN
jgi:hypothetical protein